MEAASSDPAAYPPAIEAAVAAYETASQQVWCCNRAYANAGAGCVTCQPPPSTCELPTVDTSHTMCSLVWCCCSRRALRCVLAAASLSAVLKSDVLLAYVKATPRPLAFPLQAAELGTASAAAAAWCLQAHVDEALGRTTAVRDGLYGSLLAALQLRLAEVRLWIWSICSRHGGVSVSNQLC